MFINKLNIMRSVILPTTRSLLQPRLLHSVREPTVPISPPKDKTSGTSTTKLQSDYTNNDQTNSTSGTKSSSEIESHSKIEHLSEPTLSEEIIHAEKLGLKPADILREVAEKKEKEKAGSIGKSSNNRKFSTSAKQFKSPESGEVDGGNDRIKGGSEGVEVGQGNIGKDGGEGKKETERNVSDEVKIGESDIGKMGGNQFGGGNGGGGAGAQIGSSSNQKRGFSTSIFRRVEGEGTGSKGTPKGDSKGEGLEHLKDNQPSESEEAVHADKHGKNPLEELDDSKKAASPKK